MLAGCGCWKNGGRAVSQMGATGAAHGVDRPIHKVDAPSPMNMQINKSWR
jgi:hypothetical protein